MDGDGMGWDGIYFEYGIHFRMQTQLKKHMETQSSGSFALVSSPKGSAHLPSEEEQQRMSTE